MFLVISYVNTVHNNGEKKFWSQCHKILFFVKFVALKPSLIFRNDKHLNLNYNLTIRCFFVKGNFDILTIVNIYVSLRMREEPTHVVPYPQILDLAANV